MSIYDESNATSSPHYSDWYLRECREALQWWRQKAEEQAEEYCRNYWGSDRGTQDGTALLLERLPELTRRAIDALEYEEARGILQAVHGRQSEAEWREEAEDRDPDEHYPLWREWEPDAPPF
jgi:hypothetical protein